MAASSAPATRPAPPRRASAQGELLGVKKDKEHALLCSPYRRRRHAPRPGAGGPGCGKGGGGDDPAALPDDLLSADDGAEPAPTGLAPGDALRVQEVEGPHRVAARVATTPWLFLFGVHVLRVFDMSSSRSVVHALAEKHVWRAIAGGSKFWLGGTSAVYEDPHWLLLWRLRRTC